MRLPARFQAVSLSSSAPFAVTAPLAVDAFCVGLSQVPSATPFRTNSASAQQFGFASSLGWVQSRPW
jgi:hypothetical protein